MDYMNLIISILSGLVAIIPLVAQLIKWVKTAVKERNWAKLLELLTAFMTEAEQKFETGAERKEWVMLAIKASADTINYDLDEEVISNLIDQLCDMSKVVNGAEVNEDANQ